VADNEFEIKLQLPSKIPMHSGMMQHQ